MRVLARTHKSEFVHVLVIYGGMLIGSNSVDTIADTLKETIHICT
jgi:hypothetical protein